MMTLVWAYGVRLFVFLMELASFLVYSWRYFAQPLGLGGDPSKEDDR